MEFRCLFFLLQFFQSHFNGSTGNPVKGTCVSPQYLEMGTKGTVECLFEEDFFAVLWYSSKGYFLDEPILQYQPGVGTGNFGNTSGQFDISPNGSLIIHNVSLKHEDTFTVAYVPSQDEKPKIIGVGVIVVVNPVPRYPIIDGCNHDTWCVLEAENDGHITCRVTGIRPKVQLKWRPFSVRDDTIILLTNHTLEVEEKGDVFDVTLTATYTIRYNSSERMIMECYEPSSNRFHLSRKVELIFWEDTSVSHPNLPTKSTQPQSTLDPYLSRCVNSNLLIFNLVLLVMIVTYQLLYTTRSCSYIVSVCGALREKLS